MILMHKEEFEDMKNYDETTSTADIAADKLTAEMQAAKESFSKNVNSHIDTIRKYLTDPVGNMLIRFCYQDQEVAQAVERSEKTLTDVITAITKDLSKSNPALSDVEAYARAVKEYLPAAQVNVNFKVLLPNEFDDDLALINDVPKEDKKHAIILDLFDTEE